MVKKVSPLLCFYVVLIVVPTDKNISKLIRTDKQYPPGKRLNLQVKQNIYKHTKKSKSGLKSWDNYNLLIRNLCFPDLFPVHNLSVRCNQYQAMIP